MANMQDLLINQQQINGAFDQLLINFKKDSPDRKTPDYINRKLETLDSYWAEFQSNHITLCGLGDTSSEYFTTKFYDLVRHKYASTKDYIKNYKPRGDRLTAKTSGDPATPSASPKPMQEERDIGRPMNIPGPSMVSEGTNSKTTEMLRKQNSNFRAFLRTINQVDMDHVTERWELEDLLRAIQSRWLVIDNLHWEIDAEIGDASEEYEKVFTEYEQKYHTIKKVINSKIWSLAHRDTSTPKMEIPIFAGNYHQWVSFKDLFTETIHKNPSLSLAQKMQFLKGKLKGEAERLIQHLQISNENYITCWELLNHRYNNKKLIFSSHINIMLSLPIMTHQNTIIIKKLHDTTNESLNAIKNLGVDISTWDPLLVHILCQKLDSETHADYIDSLKNPRDLPVLADFLTYLENKFTSLESSRRKQDSSRSSQQNDSNNIKKHNYKSNVNQTHSNNTTPINKPQSSQSSKTTHTVKCLFCDSNHALFYCKSFIESKPDIQRQFISKLNLCKNCLYDHKGKACISSKKCRMCQAEHNTILHEAYTSLSRGHSSSASNAAVTGSNSQQKSVSHASNDNITEILLATALVKIQGQDGTYHTMRALIDQGSQTSLIRESAAQKLRLSRQPCKGIIYGVGSKQNNCRGIMQITACAVQNNFTFNTEVFIMKSLINNLPNQTFQKLSWPALETLQLADPDYNISRPVDLLLGADVYSTIIMSGMIKENEYLPVVQQTRLGWILCGNVKSYQCNVVLRDLENIHQFWSVEDIAENSINMSQEDYQCMEQYKKETRRQDDGRYVVRLPLKSDIDTVLGESKPKAIAQFKQLEKKFDKKMKIASDYKSFISEYLSLGHMRECVSITNAGFYLPHHCVQRDDSSTTALRVVFNASGRTSTGRSLNDVMCSGPNIQQDLFSLILKWRQYEFALTADIEKMFRQILCHQDDIKYQKIVWRFTSDQKLRDYELLTVTYGMKAAPFLAMMTLKQLAIDEGHKYQSAAKVLTEDFYMDDLLTGEHSLDRARQLQSDLIHLLRSGGFNLRKWASNKPELMEDASRVNENHQVFDFKHQESTKTLGLRWHPQGDYFSYQLKINNEISSRATKRILLSEISKVFDPLGWLTPVTTKLKILFQKVWTYNLDWDDSLPEEIYTEWLKIKCDLKNIENIKVIRWAGIRQHSNIELHGFCDASTKAYGCVIYCKIISNQEKSFSSSIVMLAGKARLVPYNKDVSLPRLELCAALLLSKLMVSVQRCLINYNITKYGWSDSTAVLGWLNGDLSRWKPFVANRAKQILDVMPAKCWHYVKSIENPADSASRGMTIEQLQDYSLWWTGPAWLSSSKQNYQKIEYATNEELKPSKKQNVLTIQCVSNDDVIYGIMNKYSSFTRMLRVLAWILRVLSWGKSNQSKYLSSQELYKAKILILKYLQCIHFPEEMSCLSNKSKIISKSKLLCLNPFLDKNGLLRVGGRIKNAYISEDMKHPIILPHSSHLTDLIIDQEHLLTFHGGPRLTLSRLRHQYWILGGNRAVKKRIRMCVKCKRFSSTKNYQMMGDLPAARSNPTRPFYHTGVDFTGYVDVKSSKGRGVKSTKGYVSVFVCMATKAIHLELVSDLSSSAFLAALRRMAARRGTPGHIYSDNGTNFVGTNNILKKEYMNLQEAMDEQFHTYLTDKNIQWHFNAPSWPSAGGLWEAAVKSLKYHLRRVIGEQKLTFEEFSTLLAQIEACLNERPLCALNEDVDSLDCLTPSHFLASGPLLTIIETEKDERTRWHLIQKIYNDIWKRWNAEYLSQLSVRSKWRTQQENLQINDVVIIQDAILPPGRWALGRVTELHPGKDDLVRVVTLKTKNGTMKRPITKLSILPVNNKEQPNDQKREDDSKKQSSTNVTTRFFNIAYTTILLLLFMFTCVKGDYQVSSLNSSQNLYFDKISAMHLILDEWKLIVYYDVGPYWQGIDMLQAYIDQMENAYQKPEKPSQSDVILIQLRHGLSELQHYNNILLSQNVGNSRKRRGIINGVGYVAHSLFGILDEQFAEKYEKDIDLIRYNEKHLALLWKNQTSVVEAEYNLIKRIESSMDKQGKIFNRQLIEYEMGLNTLRKELQKAEESINFTLSSVIANGVLTNLKHIQNTLLDTIISITYGKFNIHLLSPDQLQKELNIISSHLTIDESLPISNMQSELYKLYSLLKVRARMTKNYFIFEVKILLISRDKYDIYKLISIPKVMGKTMVNISPISENLAINIHKDSFIPITINDIHECIQYTNDVIICPLQRPIYSYNMKLAENLCIKDQITDQCQTNTFKCRDKWIELYNINTYLYFCCEQCTVQIICGDQVTAERLSKAGVITISSGCIIKGETFTILSHKRHSNDLSLKADIIKIDIPPINNIIRLSISTNSSFLNEQNSSKEYQKDLETLGDEIKQLKAQEVNNSIDNNITYHDIHQYVAIYIVISACLCALAYVLWQRRRRTHNAAPAPAPASVQALTPAPAPRQDLVSPVCVQCVSESAINVKSDVNSVPVSSVSNKANSPIREHYFSQSL